MTLRNRSLAMGLLLSSLVAACGDDAPLPDVDGGALVDANVDCTQGAVCDTGNPCASGAIDCRSGAPVCVADFGTTPVAMCGTVGVCGPGGLCVGDCIPDAVCDTGNPCSRGRVDCGSGRAVCIATDDAPPGTTCGTTGICGGAGSCSVCVEGASCDTGSPCSTGRLDCSGGGAGVCVATDDLPPGTACGAGLACDTSGCTTCVAGIPCVVANSCGAGRTVCTGTTPVCTPEGVAPLGAPCRAATGPCDVAERCAGTASTCPADVRAPVGTPCAGGQCDASGACVGVDECALGTDDCDRDPAATCTNNPSGFTCACPAGFAGAARGVSGCLLSDPILLSLVPSTGALSPAFAGATTMYTVTLPPGATSLTLTPTVALPSRATVRVNGVLVSSGAPSIAMSVGLGPTPLSVIVTTESGATRAYTVVAGRGSATYVKASNTNASDLFGGLAASADGSTLAVGAYPEASNATGIDGNQADNSAIASGAVYIFTRSGSSWSQQAYIKASNSGAGDQFGYSIALSFDGSTLAVGAQTEDSNAIGIGGDEANNSGTDSGAVYVFTRAGSSWSQQAYVKASNTDRNDRFGYSVDLSSDGSTLAVSALYEASSATSIGGSQADNSAAFSGAVYIFNRAVTTWSQQAYVKASNTNSDDLFGHSVSLSSDGATLAVGARDEDSNAAGVDGNQTDNSAANAGAVYVFTRAGPFWSQQVYIKASNSQMGDRFGYSLALSSDGATLAVSAPSEASNATGIGGAQSDNSAPDAGAVYVFTRAGSTWSQEAYLKASNTDAGDFFGPPLSLSSDGSTLAVGANREGSNATGIAGDQTDNSAANAGAVYLFTRSASAWSQQAYIKASNTDASDYFGISLALTSDGSTLAVGAIFEASNATGVGGDQADNSAASAGAVYIY